jgi:tripartite-type tricarboxylate transporter receptor subunit TctC
MVREETAHDFRQTGSSESSHPRCGDRSSCAERDRVACKGATTGKIKVLGVTSEKRFPLLPDVPAISETFPQFKVISYIGFMLPRNTPKPVIATLNKEVNQILATDSMRAWLDKQGMVAVGGTPDDFRRQIEVDYQARGELVRSLGITGE